MKVVYGDELEENRVSLHRVGKSFRKRLIDGPPMSPEGFSLALGRSVERFSPRHRHNFEQFRMRIEGEADYSTDGVLKPGMMAYMPESVYYGPQRAGGEDREPGLSLTLQFGGASGEGYPGRAASMEGTEALLKLGKFEGGVFYPDPEKTDMKQMDGFQAIWEYLTGRQLTYTEPRYEKPIFMHPDSFDWIEVNGEPGAYEKVMGVFTERRAEAGFVKIDANAQYTGGGGRDLFVILSGTGTIGDQPYRKFTAVELDRTEKAVFKADEATEMVHYRLPDLSDLVAKQRADEQVAAE